MQAAFGPKHWLFDTHFPLKYWTVKIKMLLGMCDCYNNEIGFIKRKSVFKKEKPIMIVCLISSDNGKFFKKI